jgi:hypothetical protein
LEDPASDQAPGKQLAGSGAASGQQRAASDDVKQDKEGDAGSNLAVVKSSRKPVVVLIPSGVTSDGFAQWKANLLPT